jgi:ATP-dependent RNA helicase RhlE
MKFKDIELIPQIQLAISDAGYETPTPIQSQAIPLILAGHDLIGIAQTGTGKTAAFCLPILNALQKNPHKRSARLPRCLILTPTRELAIQIHKNLITYSRHLNLRHAVIFGGVGQGQQVKDLRAGTDVLVATPGRLLDLIQQKHVSLEQVEIFVLDEADRMLDMGFLPDVKRILPRLPAVRHNLFFSATMPPEIHRLAQSFLRDPKKVEVTPPATTVERIRQQVLFVDKASKIPLLVETLKRKNMKKVLVFVGMKHLADRIVEKLSHHGIQAAAIHGNKSQNARQRALESFANDRLQILIATDIASRGIDIDGITHVINYDLPKVAEDYVHRIGRTARAGSDGEALSFCSSEDKSNLFLIEKTTRQKLQVFTDHSYHSESLAKSQAIAAPAGRNSGSFRKRPFHRSSSGSGQAPHRQGNRSTSGRQTPFFG